MVVSWYLLGFKPPQGRTERFCQLLGRTLFRNVTECTGAIPGKGCCERISGTISALVFKFRGPRRLCSSERTYHVGAGCLCARTPGHDAIFVP